MCEPTPYPEPVARVATRLAEFVRALEAVDRLAREIALDLGHLDPAARLDPTAGLTNRALARLVRGIASQGRLPLEALRRDLPATTRYLLGAFDHDPDASPMIQAAAEIVRRDAMTRLGLAGPDGGAAPSES